ncbi:MAG: hypothetical protein ACLU84_06790 [Clostridia bacterium]
MSKEDFLKLIEAMDICKVKSFTINYEAYETMSSDKNITFSEK